MFENTITLHGLFGSSLETTTPAYATINYIIGEASYTHARKARAHLQFHDVGVIKVPLAAEVTGIASDSGGVSDDATTFGDDVDVVSELVDTDAGPASELVDDVALAVGAVEAVSNEVAGDVAFDVDAADADVAFIVVGAVANVVVDEDDVSERVEGADLTDTVAGVVPDNVADIGVADVVLNGQHALTSTNHIASLKDESEILFRM
ncbi:hypothetical protein ACHAWF_009834 [Thalassiosira exigua]